jgi:hypothetical protein
MLNRCYRETARELAGAVKAHSISIPAGCLVNGSASLGAEWEVAADAIIQMVQMAQSANGKVILGNVVASRYNGDYFNGWLQTYAQAQGIPVVNFAYWLFNGCASVIPPPSNGIAPCVLLNRSTPGVPSGLQRVKR